MKYTVIKQFRSGDETLEKGTIVDFAPSRRVQALITQRFLLPCDTESIEMSTVPTNEQTVKQNAKKAPKPKAE
jgi:hypothetical protein